MTPDEMRAAIERGESKTESGTTDIHAGFPVSSTYSYPNCLRNSARLGVSCGGTWMPTSTRP
jgi:hypothetical protein